MNMKSLNEKNERKWLCNTGRAHLLDFTDEQIEQMRICFDDLDADGGGNIGIEELQDPLIGLGFANTKDDVQKMVDQVDDDGSGEIEFPEFLRIINGSEDAGGAGEIGTFFKKLTAGEIGSKDISFSLFVQRSRRAHLMAAVTGDSGSVEKIKGRKIMKNLIAQQDENMREALKAKPQPKYSTKGS